MTHARAVHATAAHRESIGCCCLSAMVADIMGEQSPRRLILVRKKLYELLANCIPPDVILKVPPSRPPPAARLPRVAG